MWGAIHWRDRKGIKRKDPGTPRIYQMATGEHFNLDGHFIFDMKVTVIEKLHKTDRATREIRESMYIRDFHSELSGINKSK